jgi:hypothetical protein
MGQLKILKLTHPKVKGATDYYCYSRGKCYGCVYHEEGRGCLIGPLERYSLLKLDKYEELFNEWTKDT